MEERTIPDPEIDPETQAYWDAAGKGKFTIGKCRGCGEHHWYPRALCPFCGEETELVESAGRGEVYSFSRNVAAKPAYVLAYVRLEEGPHMMTNIVNVPLDRVAIGMKVSLTFRKSLGGFNVAMFEPVEQ